MVGRMLEIVTVNERDTVAREAGFPNPGTTRRWVREDLYRWVVIRMFMVGVLGGVAAAVAAFLLAASQGVP